jgi:hypothetical protein
MDAAGIAYRAADILSERGLAKGEYEDEHGSVCFWGALSRASGKDPDCDGFSLSAGEVDAIDRAASAILLERGVTYPCTNIIIWNDSPDVTREDVILLLKETGRRLECG